MSNAIVNRKRATDHGAGDPALIFGGLVRPPATSLAVDGAITGER